MSSSSAAAAGGKKKQKKERDLLPAPMPGYGRGKRGASAAQEDTLHQSSYPSNHLSVSPTKRSASASRRATSIGPSSNNAASQHLLGVASPAMSNVAAAYTQYGNSLGGAPSPLARSFSFTGGGQTGDGSTAEGDDDDYGTTHRRTASAMVAS